MSISHWGAVQDGPSAGPGPWAWFLAFVAVQTAMALTWSAFLVGNTASWLAAHPSDLAWIAWVAAFVAASVPSRWLSNADPATWGWFNVEAAAWTAVLADLGFLVLLVLPAARTMLFGWVPTVLG